MKIKLVALILILFLSDVVNAGNGKTSMKDLFWYKGQCTVAHVDFYIKTTFKTKHITKKITNPSEIKKITDGAYSIQSVSDAVKNLQVNAQDALFISDHVDWNDIIKAVEHTEPTQIWTLHGNGTHLKKHFGDRIFVKLLN